MDMTRVLISVGVMAGVTYLIRMLPMAAVRKRIENVTVRSFLYYVPYAVLSAMTFPDILEATGSAATAVVGTLAAVALAFLGKGLLTVAVGASAAVYLASLLF